MGVYATSWPTGKLNFNELAAVAPQYTGEKIFLLGILLVVVGLGFKIAAGSFEEGMGA